MKELEANQSKLFEQMLPQCRADHVELGHRLFKVRPSYACVWTCNPRFPQLMTKLERLQNKGKRLHAEEESFFRQLGRVLTGLCYPLLCLMLSLCLCDAGRYQQELNRPGQFGAQISAMAAAVSVQDRTRASTTELDEQSSKATLEVHSADDGAGPVGSCGLVDVLVGP